MGYTREAVVTIRCPYDNSFSVDFHIQQKPNKDFVQQSDREALVDLYAALGGDSFNPYWTNWCSDVALEEWNGVTVDEISGRVTALCFNYCEGAIPASIGNLSSLKKLNFCQCSILSIPSEICRLTELEELEINGIYNNSNNLKTLPEEIGELQSLRYLYLRNNDIKTLPKSMVNLKKLEYIDLGFNYSLGGDVLSILTELKNLRHIDLYLDEKVGGTLNNISKLTQLEYLNLGITGISGTIPSDIGALSNLEYFSVMDTNVEGALPSSMSYLTNVKVLALHGTNISGTLPEWIGLLSNLEELYLEFTDISGELPISLLNLKKIKKISFVGTNICGNIPLGLGDIPTLKSLHLSDCKLTGTIPSSLANIASLWLFNNNLSGDIPDAIINREDWRNHWGLIAVGNNLNLEGLTFPGPDFTMDVDTLDDRKYRIADEYTKNRYTILFQWSPSCPYLDSAVDLLKGIHNKYHTKGLKIIGRTFMGVSSTNMPWETYYSQQLDYPAFVQPTITVIDNSGMVIFSDVIQDRYTLESFIDKEYTD